MESDRAMLWTVSVAASLGLHVLVIVLFIGFGALSGTVYRRKRFGKDSSQVGKKSETQPKIEAPCKRFARGF